jgi:hypothetical protein
MGGCAGGLLAAFWITANAVERFLYRIGARLAGTRQVIYFPLLRNSN